LTSFKEQVVATVESSKVPQLVSLVRRIFSADSSTVETVSALLQRANQVSAHPLLLQVLNLYPSVREGIETVALLLLDLSNRKQEPLHFLQEMHQLYAPFRNSIENKETSLLIRDKRVVDEYTRGANAEERAHC